MSDGDLRRPSGPHEEPRDGGERDDASPDDPGDRDRFRSRPPPPPPPERTATRRRRRQRIRGRCRIATARTVYH